MGNKGGEIWNVCKVLQRLLRSSSPMMLMMMSCEVHNTRRTCGLLRSKKNLKRGWKASDSADLIVAYPCDLLVFRFRFSIYIYFVGRRIPSIRFSLMDGWADGWLIGSVKMSFGGMLRISFRLVSLFSLFMWGVVKYAYIYMLERGSSLRGFFISDLLVWASVELLIRLIR